jgi:hypothetical protein
MKQNFQKPKFPIGSGRALSNRFDGYSINDERKISRMFEKKLKTSFSGALNGGAVDELNSDLSFKYTIVNGLNRSVKLVLHPGYFPTVEAINAARDTNFDAIIGDGNFFSQVESTVTKYVTGLGEPKGITELLLFTKLNPQRFTHLKIMADDASQLENILEVQSLSPYRTLADGRINPSNYKNANQNNDKIADIALPNLQMSNQSLISTVIESGRRVSFIWTVGANYNTAFLLQKAAEDATRYLTGIAANQ